MRTLLATLAVLAVGGAVLWNGTDGLRAFTSEQARRLAVEKQPLALPGLMLEDQEGRPFNLLDYRGRLVLVDFIYTRCRTLCLIMGGSFQRLYKHLTAELGDEVVLLSISFDPEWDTPETLKQYARRMGADGMNWRFARPITPARLPALLKTFGIVVVRDEFGEFQHNGAIHLLDRQGRLARIVDYDAPDVAAAAVLDRL